MTPRGFAAATTLIGLLSACTPQGEPVAAPPTSPRSEETERPDGLEISVTNAELEEAPDPAGTDRTGWLATYAGDRGNAYARIQVPVDWDESDTVAYGLRLLLPDETIRHLEGPIDVLRWDNWSVDPDTTDHGGLTIDGDGRLRLIAERLERSDYRTLLGPFELPSGRWVDVRVEQELHAREGAALNRVWVDGVLRGTSDAANTFGRPITTLRAGLVAIDAQAQRSPLEVHFDGLTVETG